MGALLCIASILSMMVSAALKLEHPQSYNTSFEPRPMTQVMKLIEEATIECMIDGSCPANRPSIRNNPQPCINGMSAGFYPCNNIDLLGYLNLIDLGSSSSALGNDIWGWKDPSDNKLYALSGQTDGSTIVDVTIPTDPDPLVFIPSTLPFHVNWRDMKIFENGNFFIVADSSNHGVQYGNMRTLIDKARDFRATYNHTQIYRAKLYEDVPVNDDVGNVHNVAICEESKTLYVVGSTQGGKSANSQGGLVMYDVSSIEGEIEIVGVYAGDGYTHDAECLIYDGPQIIYKGKEICFAYNENTLTIVDVTVKSDPVLLSRTPYETSRYTHQGWLTEDQRYLLLDDELDELNGSVQRTTTYIFDVLNLEAPVLIGTYEGPTQSIDHNLYIVDDIVYESNYRAGLRVLDASNIANAELTEIAYFDVYPQDNLNQFGHGIWSAYAFWMQDENPNNHFVVGQTKAQGFFVFKPPEH